MLTEEKQQACTDGKRAATEIARWRLGGRRGPRSGGAAGVMYVHGWDRAGAGVQMQFEAEEHACSCPMRRRRARRRLRLPATDARRRHPEQRERKKRVARGRLLTQGLQERWTGPRRRR